MGKKKRYDLSVFRPEQHHADVWRHATFWSSGAFLVVEGELQGSGEAHGRYSGDLSAIAQPCSCEECL